MRRRLDAGGVEALNLLHVLEDVGELPREQRDFVRRQLEPRELGDPQDVFA